MLRHQKVKTWLAINEESIYGLGAQHRNGLSYQQNQGRTVTQPTVFIELFVNLMAVTLLRGNAYQARKTQTAIDQSNIQRITRNRFPALVLSRRSVETRAIAVSAATHTKDFTPQQSRATPVCFLRPAIFSNNRVLRLARAHPGAVSFSASEMPRITPCNGCR